MSSIIKNQINITSTCNTHTEKSDLANTDTCENVSISSVDETVNNAAKCDSTDSPKENVDSILSDDAPKCDSTDYPKENVDYILSDDAAPKCDSTDSPKENVDYILSDDAPKCDTPILNVWQLRQQVKDAADALEKATKLNADLMKQLVKQPNTVSHTVSTTEDNSSSDGFQLVNRKKNAKKSFQNKNDKTTSDNTNLSTTSKKTSVENLAYREEMKNGYLHRERKRKAFDLAQGEVINDCIKLIKGKTADNINAKLQYEINYRQTLIVRYSSDDVQVEVDGEKFVFSRTQYLGNRFFQNKVRELTDVLIPDAWIRFFPGRDEGTYCIGVHKRKEQNSYKHSSTLVSNS
jgi:hypothetical protein